MNVREMMNWRAMLIGQARALVEGAEREGQEWTDVEETQYRAWMTEVDALAAKIERSDRLARVEANLNLPGARYSGGNVGDSGGAWRPDDQRQRDEIRATAHFVRTGDLAPLIDLHATSNDTDMNITTAADGGVTVPTGHYRGIIAKRNEGALFGTLGVMPIPGIGTTVNVPIESGSANVFVSTDETTTDNDRDAPVLDKVQMTLVDFTKDIELTYDLLQDEDSNLIAFLDNYVGRALALTHNSALVTEALANGTSVALADDALASVGDPEMVSFTLAGEYADGAAWVMKRATEGLYRKLTGNPFLYQPTPAGVKRQLADFPVYNSEYVAAVGAGNKSSIFGNFSYMGMREGTLMFLRNPYLLAKKRRVVLHYFTRIVYKVLNADAILYGQHPTA